MGIFFGPQNFKFQIFLSLPNIPDFFFFFFFFGGGGGLTVGAGSKLYEGKLRVPPGVSFGTDLYFYSSLEWRAREETHTY